MEMNRILNTAHMKQDLTASRKHAEEEAGFTVRCFSCGMEAIQKNSVPESLYADRLLINKRIES